MASARRVRHAILTSCPERPHPPIFIGGGGKKTLTLAAREADIAGLEARVVDAAGSFDAFEHSEVALARK